MADRDIPEEMVEKGAASLVAGTDAVHQVRVDDPKMARWITEQVLSAALEGCAVVQLPEPDGVARDGGTYWTYPGGRVVVWPTGRFREDRVDRYRRMAVAMLAAAEFDEKQHGPASGSGGG